MLRILSPLLILGLLASCSDANLQGGIHAGSTRTPSTIPDKDTELPSSGDGKGSTDNAPAQGETPKSDPGLTSDGTVINPTPVVNPTIIAGASLTCIESSPKIELRCTVKVSNVLTDLSPLGIYIIQGKTSSWSPLKYARASVGTYLAQLSNPPASYGVAMKFENSEYAVTTVGTAPLEFADVIKDGSFEGFPSFPAVNPYSYASASDILALQSPWEVKKSSRYGCEVAEPMVQIWSQTVSGGKLDSFEGSKFVGLDSQCGGQMSTANISLSQKFQAKLNHIYQLTHARKIGNFGPTPTSEMDLYWNGDRYQTTTTSLNWTLDVRYFLSEKNDESNRLSFHETGESEGSGTLLDGVKVLDFGAPI